jgi:hypothetical protein
MNLPLPHNTMKTTLFFLFLSLAGFGSAQTKVIAHKSHSGSTNAFAKAYKNNLFDMKSSNFGLPGNQTIFVLDTVIAINDSVTILKRRESIVCHAWGTDYKKLKKNDFKTKTDTLVNSDILNAGNSIEFIKANLNINYFEVWFVNDVNDVVFIGFKPNEQWIENCRPTSKTSIKKE